MHCTHFALASLTPAIVSGAGRSSVRNNLSSWLSKTSVDWAEVGRPDRERRKIRIVSPEKENVKFNSIEILFEFIETSASNRNYKWFYDFYFVTSFFLTGLNLNRRNEKFVKLDWERRKIRIPAWVYISDSHWQFSIHFQDIHEIVVALMKRNQISEWAMGFRCGNFLIPWIEKTLKISPWKGKSCLRHPAHSEIL